MCEHNDINYECKLINDYDRTNYHEYRESHRDSLYNIKEDSSCRSAVLNEHVSSKNS